MANALITSSLSSENLGPRAVVLGGEVGEARQHIQLRQHGRRLADAARLVRHPAPDGYESSLSSVWLFSSPQHNSRSLAGVIECGKLAHDFTWSRKAAVRSW